MKLCRYILLILLTVTVPVSGFASMALEQCHDAAQGDGHEHHHHAGMAVGEISENPHLQHEHHTATQKTADQSKVSGFCKCSSSGSLALLSNTVLAASFSDIRQVAFSIQPHTLAAHHLDHLRPPIFAAI